MVVNIKSKGHASSGVSGHAGNRGSLLAKLFLSALYLGAFTFGSGYVIITLMKKEFVDGYHWTDEQEMLDLVAIIQPSPGAIAIDGTIMIGYKLAGIAGVLATATATVLPPFTILTLIFFCYATFRSNLFAGWMLNGMQVGVSAAITQVVWEMGSGIARDRRWISVLIMAAAFVTSYICDVNAVLITLLCAAIGMDRALTFGHNKKGTEEGAL